MANLNGSTGGRSQKPPSRRGPPPTYPHDVRPQVAPTRTSARSSANRGPPPPQYQKVTFIYPCQGDLKLTSLQPDLEEDIPDVAIAFVFSFVHFGHFGYSRLVLASHRFAMTYRFIKQRHGCHRQWQVYCTFVQARRCITKGAYPIPTPHELNSS